MANGFSTAFVYISLFLCLNVLHFSSLTEHPILELFAEPPEDIDSILVKRYGSLHTMRDYIYWSKNEEYIYPILKEKLSWLIHEKFLTKRYLKGRWTDNSVRIYHSTFPQSAKAIRRLGDYLAKHPYTVIRDAAHDILEINEIEFADMWFGLPEMYISIHGLQMIQRAQQWLPHKVSQVMKSETTSEIQLTQEQAVEVGMSSLFRKMYSFSVEWLEFSQTHYPNTSSTKGVPFDILRLMIVLAFQEHNKAGQRDDCWASYICHINLFTRPILKNVTKRMARRQRAVLNAAKNKLDSSGKPDSPSQFISLCSHPNQSIQHPDVVKTLKCFYERTRHPSLYISPTKVEQLSISPNVYQIYDILGPKFLKELIANYKANASLPEALTGMDHFNGNEELENLESGPAFLVRNTKMYDGHKIFYRLTEAVSGLKFHGATENLQFLMYTPGRCVGSHEDVIRDRPFGVYKLIGGKRVACILYYLELPEMGGDTPFCQGGFKAHMTTGSAIIWFNKYQNGSDRDDMFHGSCPVVQGHKLILAQAIDYLPQWNHYKCSLNQFE